MQISVGSVVQVPYPLLMKLGPSEYTSWVNISRTLAMSFTFTIIGRVSDLFGRRWFFIGGNAVALVGIIICATAKNFNNLIIGNAVYGFGEAVQLSFTVAVGELVPNKYRGMALSFIFLTNAPVTVFGPVIARRFIAHPSLGWRWCYYLNIICVGLAMFFLFFCYHPPTFDLLHERKTKKQLIKQLDCKSDACDRVDDVLTPRQMRESFFGQQG